MIFLKKDVRYTAIVTHNGPLPDERVSGTAARVMAWLDLRLSLGQCWKRTACVEIQGSDGSVKYFYP